MMVKPACLAACLVAFLAAVLAAAPRPASSVPDLVAAYAEWVQGRRAKVELTAVDLDATRQALGRLDPSAIAVDPALSPADARERQRQLITAFALEVAALGSRKHSAAAARLIEWACPYVRSHTPTSDFDLAWQLAALSALEGGIDSAVLHAHLDHAQGRFGRDSRYMLARAIADEQFSAPAEVLTRSIASADLARAREAAARAEGERYRAAERAIARFRDASKIDSLAAEATLRMGHVQYRMGRYDAAIATWTDLESLKPEPAIAYLVQLFRGLAHEGYGRTDEARASYRAALRISPGAHSATLRLSALAFLHGSADEAYPLVEALLRDDDPRRDPWWSYYAADWRLWYPRIERVRTLLRSHD